MPLFNPEPITTEQLALVRQDFLEGLPVAALVATPAVSGDLRVQAGNGLFGRLADCEARALAGMSLNEVPLIRGEIARQVTGFLAGGGAKREFRWCDGDAVSGRHFTVSLSRLSPIGEPGDRCLLTMLDRTAEVETARSLRTEMLHDSLTGLPNRVAFGEAVEGAVKAGEPFAVLMLDVRRFSRINESLGGMAGDELIITLARRLVSALRAGDLLARTGGDEFGVLFHLSDNQSEAVAGAERLKAVFDAPFRLSELEIRVDCAVGCAFGDATTDGEELVRNAQFAMKQAKLANRVEVYHPGEALLARRRFSMETELRRAIEREELTLAFQPIMDLATGKVSSFEALSRWNHPELGPVSPADFIEVAEESGLITPLGAWALDAAVRTLADWDRAAGRALPISISVNVSAKQIAFDDVPALAAAALARYGIAGERLTLELTESVIIHDPERVTEVLRALKAFSVRIALDDFGTGYSSLAYLQRLPIDVLKIDQRFVTGMLGDRDSVSIVRAVLGLADALGMDTTAEGVERIELAQTLGALGCSHAQGYLFAHPLPAETAYRFLLDGKA